MAVNAAHESDGWSTDKQYARQPAMIHFSNSRNGTLMTISDR